MSTEHSAELSQNDIVTRLRVLADLNLDCPIATGCTAFNDAADEIMRLRTERDSYKSLLAKAAGEITDLQTERDKLRMRCHALATLLYGPDQYDPATDKAKQA